MAQNVRVIPRALLLPSAALFTLAACAEPEPEPLTCPAGQVLEGELCVAEGCSAARWDEVLDDAIAYVSPVGREGAGGTRTDPFGSIQEALDAVAGDEGVVAVEAGRYEAPIVFTLDHDGLELRGRCRDEVIVEAAEDESGIEFYGGVDAEVRGLTVEGALTAFWAYSAGGPADPEIRLREVRSTGVVGGGIWVEGFGVEAELDDVEVLDGGRPEGGLTTMAVVAMDGGQITGSGLRVDGFTGVGVLAAAGLASVELSGVDLGNFRATDDGSVVAGAVVQGPASLTLEDFDIHEAIEFGAFADTEGAELVLRDGVIRDAAEGGAYEGLGIFGQEGATITLERVRIERVRSTGLYLVGPDVQVTVADVEVRDTIAEADGEHGEGAVVYEGAVLRGEGLRLIDNRVVGIGVNGAGSTADLVDLHIEGTRAADDGGPSRGVEVTDGGVVSVEGGTIRDNDQIGAAALGPDASLTLLDVLIEDQRPRPDSPEGQGGAGIGGGASITLDGVTLRRNPSVELLVAEGAATVDGLTVEDPLPVEIDGVGLARGVAVQSGGVLTADDVRIVGASDVGFFLEDGQATVTGGTIRGGRAAGGSLTGGRGITVSIGASLVADGLSLDDNQEVALLIGQEGATVHWVGGAINNTLWDTSGQFGQGVQLQEGGTFIGEDVEVSGNSMMGVYVMGEGTSAELRGVRIAGTRPTVDGHYGRGLYVLEGATATVEDTTVEANHEVAVMVSGADVLWTGGRVAATAFSIEPSGGVGMVCQDEGMFEIDGVIVEDNTGPGIVLSDGTLRCEDCELRGNAFGGYVVFEGALEVVGGVVSASPSHAEFGGGVGLFSDALGTVNHVDVVGTVFEDLRGPAIYLRERQRARFDGIVADRVATAVGAPAAVMVLDGGEPWDEIEDRGVLLSGGRIGAVAGDGVLLHDAGATIDGLNFDGSGGYDVVEQMCLSGPEAVVSAGPSHAVCDAVPRVVEPKLIFNFSALGFLVVL